MVFRGPCHEPHVSQTKISEYLRTNANHQGIPVSRPSGESLPAGQYVASHLNVSSGFVTCEYNQYTFTLGCNTRQATLYVPTATTRYLDAQQIAQRNGVLHSHQCWCGIQLSLSERKMKVSIDPVTVGVQQKLSMLSHHLSLAHPLHSGFIYGPVMDQLSNRSYTKPVLTGEREQLWQPGHGAVVIHDLTYHRRFIQSSQPGQIA